MANQTSTTNYKRLAEQVQLARRNKRLSIRKVAQMTNLPESTIRALEHPTKYDLPKANVRGLYKTYGSVVGVTNKRINDLLGEESIASPVFSLPTLKQIKKTIVVSSFASKLAVAVILVIVIGYVGAQGFGLFSSPDLVVNQPNEKISIVSDSRFTVMGEVDQDDTVLINGQPVTTDLDTGSFEQDIFLQAGYNILRVEAINGFSRSSVQEFTLIYQAE